MKRPLRVKKSKKAATLTKKGEFEVEQVETKERERESKKG